MELLFHFRGKQMPRSTGTKLVLWPSAGNTGPEFALGIESGAMWFNNSALSNIYKLYFGSVHKYTFDQNYLTLPANPVANMHAVTKQYVDSSSGTFGTWQALSYYTGFNAQTNVTGSRVNTNSTVQLRGQVPCNAGAVTGTGMIRCLSFIDTNARPTTTKYFTIPCRRAEEYDALTLRIDPDGIMYVAKPAYGNLFLDPTAFYLDGVSYSK
jgi:hypothetical protein